MTVLVQQRLLDADPDVRVEWCRVCGGDGGFDAERPGQGWLRCVACDGRGETEVRYEPMTCEDEAARVAFCQRRGIDPYEIVADGGIPAWGAVTDHNLDQEKADLANERGEELIDRHKVECEYVDSILTRAIAELETAGIRVLGAPFGGHDAAGLIKAIEALLPPDYDNSRDAIELSAIAHQAALREMD